MTEVAMEYLEDMFKEVVKKLYGEQELESSGPLKIIQTMAPEKEEDSESSLPAIEMAEVQEEFPAAVKSEALADFENAWISSDETLSWTDSSIASYNLSQKLFRCNDCECVGMLSRVAEHWLGTHANLRVFQCAQCPYASAWARCVRMHLTQQHNIAVENNGENFEALFKENPVLGEVTDYLERLRGKVESLRDDQDIQEVEGETEIDLKEAEVQVEAHLVAETTFEMEDEPQVIPVEDQQLSPHDSHIETEVISPDEEMELKPQETLITIQIPTRLDTTAPSQVQMNNTTATGKRYNCSFCSYGTDRRDLYTRHENIHKEEKPFHCYVCQKQFNRADHVKKHFLRMHRDHTYENNKIKRDLSRFSNQQVKQQFITIQKPTLPEIKIPFTYPANIVPKITFVQQRPTVIEDGSSVLNSLNSQHLNAITTQTTSVMQVHSPGSGSLGSDCVTITEPSLSTSTGSPTVINLKKPGPIKEKRFSCCYCAWSGTDNWCLKRHLNTHIKPYSCALCEYKAARPERLATHVAKVHNKRICNKCSFLADDQDTLNDHQQQHI